MSKVADKMLEVMDQVDQLSKFNSQVFNVIKNLYGENSEEFKMIREIDSKIDDLLSHLNYDEDEDFNSEIFAAEFNRHQNEIISDDDIRDLNSEE